MRNILYLILYVTVFVACEKEIDFDYHETTPLVVIEGRVTNECMEVLVTKSRAVDDSVRQLGMKGATVNIIDADGTVATLFYDTATGYYRSALTGQPGHAYQLSVDFEGRHYTASSTMPPITTILSAEFLWQPVLSNKLLVYEVWATDPLPDERNYYCYRMDRHSNHPNMQDKRQPDAYRWSVFDDRGNPPGRIYRDIICCSEETMDKENEEEWKSTLYEGDTITFQLMTIDRCVYDYYASLRTGQNNGANPRSNIIGGCLGYFAAMGITRTAPQVFRRQNVRLQ